MLSPLATVSAQTVPFALPTLYGALMPLPPQTISLFAGDDRSLPLVVYQPGTTTPQDLTGWVSLTLYLKQDSAVPDQAAALAVAGVITNAVQGQASFALPGGLTLNLAGQYWYVVRGVDGSGNRQTLASGQCLVRGA